MLSKKHFFVHLNCEKCTIEFPDYTEIIRTKGYGFVWVSGAGNAMKFNEKMQET